MDTSYECLDLMSSDNSDQKQGLKARKKKRKSKRKATSPLSDSEQKNNNNNGVRINGSDYVSNLKSGFCFPNPQNLHPIMSFSQQGAFNQSAPMFGTGTYAQPPPPNLSPTQMTSFAMPLGQASGPPNWANELMSEVKAIKQSLVKLETIEKTVNMINAKVTDLEAKINTIDARVITAEN